MQRARCTGTDAPSRAISSPVNRSANTSKERQTNDKSVTDMKWHKPTELPKDGQVVLAKVKGLKFLEYAVVEYMSDCWWRYAEYWTPGAGKVEGWCGCELEIVEWTEIQ